MLVEDTAAYLADFGVDAQLNGVPVRGIFDSPYAAAFGMVAGQNPSFLVPATVTAARGATLSVASAMFVVVDVIPDAVWPAGFTALQLEEAQY